MLTTSSSRSVWDSVVAGPRGRVIGPLRAAIHAPDLARAWSALGESLRFGTSLECEDRGNAFLYRRRA